MNSGPIAAAAFVIALVMCAMILPAAWHCRGFTYSCFDRAMGMSAPSISNR